MSPVLSQLLSLFQDASVQGIPLVALIVAFTEFVSSVKFNGKSMSPDASRVTAYLMALLFGFGFEVSAHGVPADFVAGFGYFVYSVAFGVVATKLYDVATASPKQ
jgi:hypothetical protein